MSDAAWMIAGLYVMAAAGFAVSVTKTLMKEEGRASLWSIIAAAIVVCSAWAFWIAFFAMENAGKRYLARGR